MIQHFISVLLLAAGSPAAPSAATQTVARAEARNGSLSAHVRATFMASSLSVLNSGADTLRLGALYDAALAADPRSRERALLRSQSALRLRNLDTERLPSLTAQGQAQYQSDVPTIPIRLPNGQGLPGIPHDTYDAHLSAQESLFDPTLGARHAVERAQLAASEAGVRTTLYGVRQQVDESFFAAALLQARGSELAAAITGLEAQLRTVQARVQAGAALAGDAATIEAELLRRRQDEAELRANRSAALAVLSDLTGRPINEGDVLDLPNLSARVAQARATTDTLHRRPEYDQFALSRELLARQADVTTAQTRPRLSAFGRLGYGRPGLDFLSDQFDSYWLAGVQVQWSPWNWGRTTRERQTIEIQQQIVSTQQAAFTRTIRRATAQQLATIDRLHAALATDDRIVALRDRIQRETQARFDEGVVTAADYIARRSDALDARLTRDTHRVQLAEASARYLTTLGMEIH